MFCNNYKVITDLSAINMKKPIKVGLIEIPISTFEEYAGIDEDYFKLPIISWPKTGELRLNLERRIKDRFRNQISLENEVLDGFNRGKLNNDDFQIIGSNFKKKAREYDFTMVFAEDHSAAYPLYFLPGKVLRMDCHGDAFVSENIKKFSVQLNYATYMYCVEKSRVKNTKHIDNIGIKYPPVIGRSINANELTKNYNILDLDLDAFEKKYHFQWIHDTSDVKLELLKSILTENINQVGIFEYRKEGDPYNNVEKFAYKIAEIVISKKMDKKY